MMLEAAFFLLLGWLALTRRVDPVSIAAGVVAVVAVLAVRNRLFPARRKLFSSAVRHPIRLILFLASLATRFVLSTTYTARLILFGHAEGRVVALPIRVTNPIGQLLLLNAITLTPSTISLLIEGDLLYIHWLRGKEEQGDWRAIKESLERRVLALYPQDTP